MYSIILRNSDILHLYNVLDIQCLNKSSNIKIYINIIFIDILL